MNADKFDQPMMVDDIMWVLSLPNPTNNVMQ